MHKNLKTLVFGASVKPHRYSNLAAKKLKVHGHDVIPVGLRKGEIDGVQILTGTPDVKDVHTITMYVNPQRQTEYYAYLLGLNPKRIIFNPGTENQELAQLARKNGIHTENSCTLVLLNTDSYGTSE